jgi:hypothetical protein
MMDVEELFRHALATLPEAVGDLLRDRRDPSEFVFASFDGASEIGVALIVSDLVCELGVDAQAARLEAVRMLAAAETRGEEIVISLMITKDVVARILAASGIDSATRLGTQLWLESPVEHGRYRVIAVCGADVRAATVDGSAEVKETHPPPTLN